MLELQFEKVPCRFLKRIAGGVQNVELTQELKLTDGMPDIGRVLCAWGQVIARGKEWNSDQAVFSGGVMLWALYLPEDGTEPRCMDCWLPFQVRWDLPQAAGDGTLCVSTLLRFADARSVSPRKLILRTGVGAKGDAYMRDEAQASTPEGTEADVELLKRSYPLRLLREAGEKTIQLDEELSLPGSLPQPEKILYATLSPEITDRKVMTDKIVFRGNANLHILFRGEEGKLFAWDGEMPFSQFADLDQAHSPEAEVSITMNTTNLETDLDDEGHLRVKCGLVGQYMVEDIQLIQVAEDAYCPGRDCDIQMETLEIPAVLERQQETLPAEQTLQTDASEIIDAVFLPDYPRQRRNGDTLQLELTGNFQVLSAAADGSLQAGTARWEGQWSMKADEGTAVDVRLTPGNQAQAFPGNGIRASGAAQLQTTAVSESPIPMVTGLTLGEQQELDPDRPSLILRRAGEQGLWEIARSCGSTVADIQRINALEGEPAAEQMLLIPVR